MHLPRGQTGENEWSTRSIALLSLCLSWWKSLLITRPEMISIRKPQTSLTTPYSSVWPKKRACDPPRCRLSFLVPLLHIFFCTPSPHHITTCGKTGGVAIALVILSAAADLRVFCSHPGYYQLWLYRTNGGSIWTHWIKKKIFHVTYCFTPLCVNFLVFVYPCDILFMYFHGQICPVWFIQLLLLYWRQV